MELDQYTGVATTKSAPEGYDCLPVAEADWAVFTVVGPFPKAVQDTWARIYGEWLPGSDYQLVKGPSMLWYESPDLTKPDCKNEIWIPVELRKMV
jgi:AraC family transcriptional regulator